MAPVDERRRVMPPLPHRPGAIDPHWPQYETFKAFGADYYSVFSKQAPPSTVRQSQRAQRPIISKAIVLT